MAITTVATLRPAIGSPGDIFETAAPVIGADPPKATEIKDGDVSVSSQTGALTYSYPIAVPPGRNGMAPHLALSYSSQAAIYGGIAAGWTLSIPEIREDTSHGRMRTHDPALEASQSDPRADDTFVSSLSGGRPLVLVNEPKGSDAYATYRAQNDASFLRYERIAAGAFRWRVYAPDGTTYFFGETTATAWRGSANCANLGDGNAPLTTVIDPFGNVIRYHWGPAGTGFLADDCRLDSVSYGANQNASVADFATVTFNYELGPICAGIRVGSSADYRQGFRNLRGATKLRSITAVAYPSTPGDPDHTRQITLGYADANSAKNEESCTAGHAAIRLLTSIQESAWGRSAPRVDLPAVTMSYGNPTVTLAADGSSQTPWTPAFIPIGYRPFVTQAPNDNFAWGWRFNGVDRWPTVEAMLLDVDGDGLLDRVRSEPAFSSSKLKCRATWQRNRSGDPGSTNRSAFGAPKPLSFGASADLPMLRWKDDGPGNSDYPFLEGCALNGQHTAFKNSHQDSGHCRDESPNGVHAACSFDSNGNALLCADGTAWVKSLFLCDCLKGEHRDSSSVIGQAAAAQVVSSRDMSR